jgi:hypothetical protein
MPRSNRSADVTLNHPEAKVSTSDHDESGADRKLWHWLDGLPETIGVLSIFIYLLSVSMVLLDTFQAFFATNDWEMLFVGGGSMLGGFGILVSIAGVFFGFRSYKRFLRVFLTLQIPLFLLELIAWGWIRINVIPNLESGW